MEIFGPVPSRRFGNSIGVNHIPPKICSYACRYCQLGNAIHMQTERGRFYEPEALIKEVEMRLKSVSNVDYITLVPDGEPTLDREIGTLLRGLKQFGIPLAVITNASMLWDKTVRKELAEADCVSVKVDAINENIWRKVDRPHKNLNFTDVLNGVRQFAQEYQGKLITESMLIQGYNDNEAELAGVAKFIGEIKPATAYIAIPTRPPADKNVLPADEKALQIGFAQFSEHIKHVEFLIGYEGNAFSASGDAESDLLSITAVHPMREDAVMELLEKNNADFSILEKLVAENKILRLEYQNNRFYLRRLSR
jgi:wyosine [tRNA(Phe)-imidazoG37] synthetase (radical SAM superfamily)